MIKKNNVVKLSTKKYLNSDRKPTKKYAGSKSNRKSNKKPVKFTATELDKFFTDQVFDTPVDTPVDAQDKSLFHATEDNSLFAQTINAATGQKSESNNVFPIHIQTKEQEFEYAKKFLEEHKITISTITLDCKLGTLININLFAKYLVLKENEVVSVKYGHRNNPATNRTIVVIAAKKKPSKKSFYNQVTIRMKPKNNPDRNYLNIKVFKNGSLQITGCKDMDDFYDVTQTLVRILRKGRMVEIGGEKKLIKYVKEPENLDIKQVKIRMINSNFKLNYKVDRKQLAVLLKKNHRINTKDTEIGPVDFKYKPTGGHSCVNIKHHYDEISKPSIFVFQTGSIIITGAKNLQHIISSYIFIQKILTKYHQQIIIPDLDINALKREMNLYFRNKYVTRNKVSMQKYIILNNAVD